MDPMQFLALAYISLVSIKEHPRNSGGADLEACMELACEMLAIYSHKVCSWEDFVERKRAQGN